MVLESMRLAGYKTLNIFVAELSTETNTFSPIPTGIEDFMILRAEDIDAGLGQLSDDAIFKCWEEKAYSRKDNLIFGLSASAQPAGITTQAAYETLRDELMDRLHNAGKIDIVLLSLHGAMVAQGYDDCEADLLERIRAMIGSEVTVAAVLDLHCHMTEAMLNAADLLLTYKEYPHVDVAARADELYSLAVATALGKYQPYMALFDCKMIGMYPTSTPVMRGFINLMRAYERKDEVLSVSFAHGFPYGDVPDTGGKILVMTNDDRCLAERLAEDLGRQVLAIRKYIGFKPLGLEDALEQALTSYLSGESKGKAKPVVIADQSDNPGGGAPSDATFALRWLLNHEISPVGLAIFFDPQVVKLAVAAGEGADLHIRLGGKLGPSSGNPIDIYVTVRKIRRSYWHEFPQQDSSSVLYSLGDAVSLEVNGICIIVSSERCQCYSPRIFKDFGVPIEKQKLLIVKSAQHFHAAFRKITNKVIYMAAPGAVPPIVQQINYLHMNTADKYPWAE